MARLSSRTVVLRTLLVEAMAAAGEPLSTEELRDRLPVSVLPWRSDPRVYHSLRALERMGVCRRQYGLRVERRIIDTRFVYWKYTQDEAFAAMLASLESDDTDHDHLTSKGN